ncbi:uncharacterized protein LOC124166049 [Ischnura elegans]|uniref:uncharacterized protein LOC124166049 n=1 Tax=Ischnura elegans TaxID=197161 RepID=UPI001ED8A6F4|nr:uncharacterized protein LOC124166049 [Ischnura elegans]
MVRWQRLVFLIFMLTLSYGRSAAHDSTSDDIEGCYANDPMNIANDVSMDFLIPSARFEIEGIEYTVYEDNLMNWCSARSHCIALADGSHLATVSNRAIFSKLTDEGITKAIWTGGRARGGQWVWDNSRDGQFSDDEDSGFVEYCLYSDIKLGTDITPLRIEDCGRELGFICQKDPPNEGDESCEDTDESPCDSSSFYETEEEFEEWVEDP